MHTFDGLQGYCLAICKLLRPDLACLSSTLVAVALVEFNASLGVIAYTFAVVGIGFKSLTLVVGPQVTAYGQPLLGIGELCGRVGVGHTASEELVAGFIALWRW